jgi:hypothetical protein
MEHDKSDFCAYPDVSHTLPSDREIEERDEKILVLTPWTVQNICFETIKNYMIINPPQKQGYKFSQKYHPDDLRTEIALEIAYNYKDVAPQKRPGIFVSRGDVSFVFPTINQSIGINNAASEKHKYTMVQMPVFLSVVATNIGFTEQLAEYIFKIFFNHQENIRNDFCLRQIKLMNMSPPQLYLESKDHFYVSIQLMTAFDIGAVIKKDDLLLKTVSYNIFIGCLDTLYK